MIYYDVMFSEASRLTTFTALKISKCVLIRGTLQLLIVPQGYSPER